jgi:hypothetical protein
MYFYKITIMHTGKTIQQLTATCMYSFLKQRLIPVNWDTFRGTHTELLHAEEAKRAKRL